MSLGSSMSLPSRLRKYSFPKSFIGSTFKRTVGGAVAIARVNAERTSVGCAGSGGEGGRLVVRMFAEMDVRSFLLCGRLTLQFRRRGQTPPALRYSRSIASPIIADVTMPPSSSASSDACNAAFLIWPPESTHRPATSSNNEKSTA
jgi:hypothetical protein